MKLIRNRHLVSRLKMGGATDLLKPFVFMARKETIFFCMWNVVGDSSTYTHTHTHTPVLKFVAHVCTA